jgi:hypothetical protein
MSRLALSSASDRTVKASDVLNTALAFLELSSCEGTIQFAADTKGKSYSLDYAYAFYDIQRRLSGM